MIATQSLAFPLYHNSKGIFLPMPDVNDPKQWEENVGLRGSIYQSEPEARCSVVLHSRTLELRRLKYVPITECPNISGGLVGQIRSYAHKNVQSIVCKAITFYGNPDPYLVSFGFGDEDRKTFLMRDASNIYKADSANVVAILSDTGGVTIALFDVEGSNRHELSVTHVARPKPPAVPLPPRK